MNRPVQPAEDSADDTTFWAEAAQGRLVFQSCDACSFVRWPAAGVCPECLSRDFTWSEVEPLGRLWSVAVYHRAYAPHLSPDLPYAVALVELRCGVRLLARLGAGADARDLLDRQVEARFEEMGTHGVVPVFYPVA